MATGLLPLATEFIKSKLIPSVDANATPFYTEKAAPAALSQVPAANDGQDWYQMKSGTSQTPQEQSSGLLGNLSGIFNDPERMARLALAFNSMTMRPDAGIQQMALNTIQNAQKQRAIETQRNQTKDALLKMGMDESQIDLLAQNPELMKVALTAIYKKKAGLDTTAELQTWNAMTADLSKKDKDKATRIKLGLEARPSSALTVSPDFLFGQRYAGEAGAEAAKSEAAAVRQSEVNSRLRGMINDTMDTLGASLGATGQTGKLFGNIPAITTSAQIAENAKALMLPVMKSIFRGAGEGVFTDKDQEALEAMLPTRDMTSDAAKQALVNVKRLIEFKLQDPTFDISAYGGALKGGAIRASTPTPLPPPSPAAVANDVRSAADAIISGAR